MTLEKQKNRQISDHENAEVLIVKPNSNMCVFGTRLDILTGSSSTVAVPFVIARLCCYIEKHGGLLQQDLLEQTEKSTEVAFLKNEFNESGDAALELRGNVSVAVKLLKTFFEELPEPLIPSSMHAAFFKLEECMLNSSDCIRRLKSLVDDLPSSAFCVLKYLSHFLLHITMQNSHNSLNPVSLSVVFGPVIFRSNNENSSQRVMIKNITHCFVADYYAIFEQEDVLKNEHYVPSNLDQVSLLPSSIRPVVPMEPLSVIIPPLDSMECKDTLNADLHFSVFSNNRQDENINDRSSTFKPRKSIEDVKRKLKLFIPGARKRKDDLLISNILLSCNSDEKCSVPVISDNNEPRQNDSFSSDVFENNCTKESSEMFFDKPAKSFTRELVHEKHDDVLSPHPPDPKRRELEFLDNRKNFCDEKYNSHHRNFVRYYSDSKSVSCKRSSHSKARKNLFEKNHYRILEKSSHNEKFQSQNYTTDDVNDDDDLMQLQTSSNDNSCVSDIIRPASCPVPDTDEDCDVEAYQQPSLSLSWSTLFDAEEPVVSESRLSWHARKNVEEVEIISPIVQHFEKFDSELGSNVPSSPIEQEHFHKSPMKEDIYSVPIKQLSKKIHGLKKKIRLFDEKYEADYGYKPSQAEKMNFPEAKKLLNDLHKARKELKALKEESHLISAHSCGSWSRPYNSNILEDTTNCVKDNNKHGKEVPKKMKSTVQKSWDETLKTLDGDRKLANRPEGIEDMTSDQIRDEKLAIQKALLQFESVHGKPSRKTDRNTIRPLYERYRNIKRLLVKSNSFPCAKKSVCNSLEPIMEHETMDFRAVSEEQKINDYTKLKSDYSDAINQEIEGNNTNSIHFHFLDSKYNNSNLHELPLPEMIFQQHQTRLEKRRIRKILRDFEDDFMRNNGRKIQKEDKAPMESVYEEYKLVKARYRLLEALISKHQFEHQND